jgi:hypothetical protein
VLTCNVFLFTRLTIRSPILCGVWLPLSIYVLLNILSLLICRRLRVLKGLEGHPWIFDIADGFLTSLIRDIYNQKCKSTLY